MAQFLNACATTLVFAAAFIITAQPVEISEPEYIGSALHLDSGKLVQLETQPLNGRMRTKALGLGGGRMTVSFRGAKSPIRIAGDHPEFVTRMESGAVDPASMVSLDGLRADRSTREITIASAGPMGFGGKSTLGESVIKLSFSKFGEHSVKFSPTVRLAAGEYVITLKAGGGQAFLFGVDN